MGELTKINTIAGPTTAAAASSGVAAKTSAAEAPKTKSDEAKQEKPKTHAELEKEVVDRLNKSLEKFDGESLDPHKERISFNYPYIEKNEVKETSCAIFSDKLKIGDITYNISLTAGAELTGIAIQGPIETGTVTIKGTVPILGEREKIIPLKQLLGHVGHVEKLRRGPSEYEVKGGSATITFTKTA